MELRLGVVDGQNYTGILDFSPDEYKKYIESRNRLIAFQKDQQLFTMVNWNYKDIHEVLNLHVNEYAKDPSMNWSKMDNIMLDINRHLLNFLSACRTYLDHTETSLKRKFGSNSDQCKKFKEACSLEYDNNFSYRFLYKLRNYAQHCGMPAGQFSIGSEVLEPHDEVQHFIQVFFDKNQLLNNFDKWGPVKSEIESLPGNFEVIDYIDEVMASYERINLIHIGERLPQLFEDSKVITDIIEPLTEYKGIPCIFDARDMSSEGGKLKVEWFPIYLIDMVNEYII